MITPERIAEAQAVITATKHPLVVLLEAVDPDALGSGVAVARALQERGLQPVVYCGKDIPASLSFLLGDLVVVHDKQTLDWHTLDLAILVDVGSVHRTGIKQELLAFLKNGKQVLNIDHHHVYEQFGAVDLVDETASATTVLIYDLLKFGGYTVTPPIATAILAGILADTGNFTNAATTSRALQVAAECYAKGAAAQRVIRELYQHRPIGALTLWGRIFSRLIKHSRWHFAATVILQRDLEELDLTEEAADGVANFMNGIPDITAGLVLTELPNGMLKGSMRTTRDDIDVSQIAAALGGGGHKKAAGFTIVGKIEEIPNGGWYIV